MSVVTYSKIYYNYVVTTTNNLIDFQESAGVLLATLTPGSYTLTTLASEIKRALDAAGLLTYTVTVNRSTRKYTISAGSTFKLLTTSGTHLGFNAFTLIGFSGADKTGASSYVGQNATGVEFKNQFKFQDHISNVNWEEAISSTINESADGTLELITFGTRQFVQLNIIYATNIPQASNSSIRNNPTGVDDLRLLLQYLRTKGPIEYMENESDPTTFLTLICESTPDSNTGTAFKIKEMYDKGLPGYFQTGDLKMRVVT